jgi:hypothetical protein
VPEERKYFLYETLNIYDAITGHDIFDIFVMDSTIPEGASKNPFQ